MSGLVEVLLGCLHLPGNLVEYGKIALLGQGRFLWTGRCSLALHVILPRLSSELGFALLAPNADSTYHQRKLTGAPRFTGVLPCCDRRDFVSTTKQP